MLGQLDADFVLPTRVRELLGRLQPLEKLDYYILALLMGDFLRIQERNITIGSVRKLVIQQHERQVLVEVQFLESPQRVLGNNHLLFLISAYIIGNVREKINEGVGEVADQLNGVFLGAHAGRKRLSDDEVERSPRQMTFTAILCAHLLVSGELGIVLFHD